MRRSRWIFLVLAAGCQGPHAEQHPAIFEPGGDGDPVLAMAKSALTTTQTSQVVVTNATGYAFSQGLITKVPLFTVGQVASPAFSNFVTAASATAGNPTALAQALGLTLGTDAWVVTAAAAGGGKGSAWVEADPTQALYYVGKVVSSVDDFIGTGSFTLANPSATLLGYDPNDNAGKVTLGNGTTGSNLGQTILLGNITQCGSTAVMTLSQVLLSEPFTSGANSPAWPANIGWAGDFNGDWYTDGISARVRIPGQPGTEPSAPSPTVTGFVKFIDLCPTTNATLTVTARVDTTKYQKVQSDTTLVVYFFDGAGANIKIATNYPLYRGNDRTQAAYDIAIPSTTRRLAIAPMAYIASGETQSVFYQQLDVNYVVSTQTSTSLGGDAFTSYGTNTYGKNQPTGWSEFGGDWYVEPSLKVATLWNPKWGGDQSSPPPVDTGMIKSFSLGTVKAGDTLDVKMFAAATFTDDNSFVRLRAIFNTGQTFESERLSASAYSDVWLRRIAVPSNASSVKIDVNAFLGTNETSSLYVDDLTVTRIR